MRLRNWAPAGLILLAVIPMVAGSLRVTELVSGLETIPSEERFTDSPVPVILHIVSATIFTLVGAFQFAPALRRRPRTWHRRAGRILIPAGLLAALTGLWMAVFYALPPSDGPLLLVFRVIFGTYMVLAIALAVRSLVRRDFPTHGAWMTRAYALGIAAGTQAVLLLPFTLAFGGLDQLPRALIMGGAWVLNLAIAELVIRARRRKRALRRRRGPGANAGAPRHESATTADAIST